MIEIILVNQTNNAAVGSSRFRLVLLTLRWNSRQRCFLFMMKTLFLLQLHLKPLSKAMGYCQTVPRVFRTAIPGLIPPCKSSKLSADKPLLTSLAWKPWGRNRGQIHWLLKGIWFSVSRLPIGALSSAVGVSVVGAVLHTSGWLPVVGQLQKAMISLWWEKRVLVVSPILISR